MNHGGCGCHVPAYNEFSKIKQVGAETARQSNLGDKLARTFDKVMSPQEAVMHYQAGSGFHIFLKTYLMSPTTAVT